MIKLYIFVKHQQIVRRAVGLVIILSDIKQTCQVFSLLGRIAVDSIRCSLLLHILRGLSARPSVCLLVMAHG